MYCHMLRASTQLTLAILLERTKAGTRSRNSRWPLWTKGTSRSLTCVSYRPKRVSPGTSLTLETSRDVSSFSRTSSLAPHASMS